MECCTKVEERDVWALPGDCTKEEALPGENADAEVKKELINVPKHSSFVICKRLFLVYKQ
jgi:hypothetical protein